MCKLLLCFVLLWFYYQFLLIHVHSAFVQHWDNGMIVSVPWKNPERYGKINSYQTTIKHKKTWTVCIFRGMYLHDFLSCFRWVMTYRYLQYHYGGTVVTQLKHSSLILTSYFFAKYPKLVYKDLAILMTLGMVEVSMKLFIILMR